MGRRRDSLFSPPISTPSISARKLVLPPLSTDATLAAALDNTADVSDSLHRMESLPCRRRTLACYCFCFQCTPIRCLNSGKVSGPSKILTSDRYDVQLRYRKYHTVPRTFSCPATAPESSAETNSLPREDGWRSRLLQGIILQTLGGRAPFTAHLDSVCRKEGKGKESPVATPSSGSCHCF